MLDIVILGLRRKCFSELMDSFIKHFDKSEQELRLVLHIDYLDCYNTYDIESDISKYLYLFKTSTIKIEKGNVGHTKSWVWCLNNIKNDYIYLEDDKIFCKDISFNAIKRRQKDMVSLEGRRGRVGHLDSFYAVKAIRDYLLRHYPPESSWKNDAERMNKIILEHAGFSYCQNNRVNCVGGTGMDNLSEHNLIRVRKGRTLNSPIYVPTPKNISYILHGEDNKNAKKLREFYLCINSFPVFDVENLNIDDIKTSHIGILSRDCKAFAAVTWLLNYDEIKEYDLTGTVVSRNKIFYVKTEFFKKYYTSNIDTAIFAIWMFPFKIKHNNKLIQEMGFELH